MQNEQFIGAWRLKSFDIISPDQDRRSWGKNVQGLLIYSASGCMSVALQRELSSEMKDPTDAYVFYGGRFEVHGAQVIHHVEFASDNERIGESLIRHVSWNEGSLTLRTPRDERGEAELVWIKI